MGFLNCASYCKEKGLIGFLMTCFILVCGSCMYKPLVFVTVCLIHCVYDWAALLVLVLCIMRFVFMMVGHTFVNVALLSMVILMPLVCHKSRICLVLVEAVLC